MPELVKIQCPCGATFQTLPGMGDVDEDGNVRCENCAVEMGLRENLSEEPSDEVVQPEVEGADAVEDETADRSSQGDPEPIKIDGRTKAAREAKKAARVDP